MRVLGELALLRMTRCERAFHDLRDPFGIGVRIGAISTLGFNSFVGLHEPGIGSHDLTAPSGTMRTSGSLFASAVANTMRKWRSDGA